MQRPTDISTTKILASETQGISKIEWKDYKSQGTRTSSVRLCLLEKTEMIHPCFNNIASYLYKTTPISPVNCKGEISCSTHWQRTTDKQWLLRDEELDFWAVVFMNLLFSAFQLWMWYSFPCCDRVCVQLWSRIKPFSFEEILWNFCHSSMKSI